MIRFFLQQFKQYAQAEAQRAMAASKKLWGSAFASPEADKLLVDRVGTIFKAILGIQTGIDVDRPGRAFDCKALSHGAAKASDLAQERAYLLEQRRQELIQQAVAAQTASSTQQHQRQQIEDDKAGHDRDRPRVPSWKRGRNEEDDRAGPRPGGR
ncbi:hypothetical protein ASF66_21715 [Pseudomonas sp. Leaf129]|nr:hypothetical protein ASF66_21715 [Pseudomonas sp. Leaf129]